MNNKLAENMLRFGVKNLTESNIKRLSEQDPNEPLQPGQEANPLPDTPKSPDKLIDPKEVDIAAVKSKLKGTTANFVRSLLKYNNFLSVAKDGNLLINITGFSYAYAKYLGGPKLSSLDSLIGKTMLRFKSPNWFTREGVKSGGQGGIPVRLENNMLDSHLAEMPYGMYTIKAAVNSPNYRDNNGTGKRYPFIALSWNPLTTNYSGDPKAPLIANAGGGSFEKTMPSPETPLSSLALEAPSNIRIPLGVPRGGSNTQVSSLPKNWPNMLYAPVSYRVYTYDSGDGERNPGGKAGNSGYPGGGWETLTRGVGGGTAGAIQNYRGVGTQEPN